MVASGSASAAINGRSDMRKCNACTSSFSLFSAELLKDNGCAEGFWMGNLKHKNVAGERRAAGRAARARAAARAR